MRSLVSFGLGALAMYLLDPEQGRRRRALLRGAVAGRLEPQMPSESPPSAKHLGR